MASSKTAPAPVPRALSPHLYLDSEVLRVEDERIFSRTWQFAGHISQLPAPGTYLTANAGTQPVLVVVSKPVTLRSTPCVPARRRSVSAGPTTD